MQAWTLVVLSPTAKGSAAVVQVLSHLLEVAFQVETDSQRHYYSLKGSNPEARGSFSLVQFLWQTLLVVLKTNST